MLEYGVERAFRAPFKAMPKCKVNLAPEGSRRRGGSREYKKLKKRKPIKNPKSEGKGQPTRVNY